MAATFNPGGGRARYALRRRYQPITDINVTPLVDVMLVLLIVFMVTAPLLTVGVQVDLPKVQNEPITTQELEELLVEAWLCRASRRLAAEYRAAGRGRPAEDGGRQ